MQPKYRSEITGMVKETIADFESSVRNQLANGEDFLFVLEDSWSYDEYKDWLTQAEMAAAFKRAFKPERVAA